MKTVYVCLSLTHVKTEEEKNEVRAFLLWLKATFNVEVLPWAFDVNTWSPLPVDNIYEFDTRSVRNADLMIILYLSNEGSDGRGGEVINRVNSGKPVLAFAKHGVKVSRYPADCLKTVGVDIERFGSFLEMTPILDAVINHDPQSVFALATP